MGPCVANRATFFQSLLSPPGEQCGLYPSLARGSLLGGGFPNREVGLLVTELSSLIKGLFWLMRQPWRKFSPSLGGNPEGDLAL